MLVGGMTRVEIGSALLSDGATTAEVSAAYVEHLLAPWLRPGQIVILNNLSAQTNVRRRRLVEAARYQIRFLLAYSPDFSPIELAFSRLKTHLCAARARTRGDLECAIATGLDRINPVDVDG